MKQREIKIPLTCKALLFLIWIIGTIVATVSLFTVDLSDLNSNETAFVIAINVVNWFFFSIVFGYECIVWLRKEPRLPFKFSCNCEEK